MWYRWLAAHCQNGWIGSYININVIFQWGSIIKYLPFLLLQANVSLDMTIKCLLQLLYDCINYIILANFKLLPGWCKVIFHISTSTLKVVGQSWPHLVYMILRRSGLDVNFYPKMVFIVVYIKSCPLGIYKGAKISKIDND